MMLPRPYAGVVAERLGSLLVLAEAADANPEPHPDVVALEQLGHDRSALPTLDAVTAKAARRATLREPVGG